MGNLIINKEKLLIALLSVILFFTFIFSNQLRIGVLGHKLGVVNYFATVVLILIFSLNYKKINIKYIIFLVLILIYYIFTYSFLESNKINVIYSVVSFYVPLVLIGLNLQERAFLKIIKIFLMFFNCMIVIITIMGVVDKLFYLSAINLVKPFLSEILVNQIEQLPHLDIKRMYSYMGHPLFNTQLYLMFYIINCFYNKYIKTVVPSIILIIITTLGISLTASKIGLILLIVSILFIYSKKIKISTYIWILFIIFILLSTGIFEDTFLRFMSGSLTTGRSEKWEVIKYYNLYPIKFFTGYGLDFTFYYNKVINWASAAFEYPFRMFSLEQGILNTIFIYICIMAIPTIKFIKDRRIELLIGFLIVFIDVNTYNGLSLKGDYMLIFCLFTFILMNLSTYIKTKRIINSNGGDLSV